MKKKKDSGIFIPKRMGQMEKITQRNRKGKI
jgi:hypothetical protein